MINTDIINLLNTIKEYNYDSNTNKYYIEFIDKSFLIIDLKDSINKFTITLELVDCIHYTKAYDFYYYLFSFIEKKQMVNFTKDLIRNLQHAI